MLYPPKLKGVHGELWGRKHFLTTLPISLTLPLNSIEFSAIVGALVTREITTEACIELKSNRFEKVIGLILGIWVIAQLGPLKRQVVI